MVDARPPVSVAAQLAAEEEEEPKLKKVKKEKDKKSKKDKKKHKKEKRDKHDKAEDDKVFPFMLAELQRHVNKIALISV